MLSMTTKTEKTPQEVLDLAVEFFGENGVGLENNYRDQGYARFKGGGGHIQVAAYEKDQYTNVDIEAREWDFQVKRFLQKL